MSVQLISPAGSLVTTPEALAEQLVAQGFVYNRKSQEPVEETPAAPAPKARRTRAK